MEWVLLIIVLAGDLPEDKKPFPLVRYSDEVFSSEDECIKHFRDATFYKQNGELVAWCQPIKKMMLSPQQLRRAPPR